VYGLCLYGLCLYYFAISHGINAAVVQAARSVKKGHTKGRILYHNRGGGTAVDGREHSLGKHHYGDTQSIEPGAYGGAAALYGLGADTHSIQHSDDHIPHEL